jgi:hypothetical protein
MKAVGLAAIGLAAGIPFVLGKYFELNYPDPFDSAIYAYSAQHILNGAKIGVEEIPSAQIGTLVVNMAGVALTGFNEIGPKLIQGLLQLGALILMFVAMRRLFGSLPAAVGVIVASVYLSAPVIAKYGNVKEQHMIGLMVMGISCFILYQLDGPQKRRWWLALLAGGLMSWAPLFKQTGMSVICAVGLFVLAQPILRHRTLKQTGIDIGLLLAGAGLALAPLYIWILGWGVQLPLPYNWVGFVFAKLLPATRAATADPNAASGDYVTTARGLVTWSQQSAMVFRYYGLLILPVLLASVAVVVRLARLLGRRLTKSTAPAASYDRFVLLLAVWWLLDMAFVWVSPRPYEQYYLPLNASAAMLGGYGVAVYLDKVKAAVYRKAAWVGAGVAGVVLMLILAYPIFAGILVSPATGMVYKDQQGTPTRTRGYTQKLDEISSKKYLEQIRQSDPQRAQQYTPDWEQAADYIRAHSQKTDGIYVWGWIPGIYVRAQRFSPAPVACTSEMHVYPPATLAKVVNDLVAAFEARPPKFIVDTHNRHFPYDPPRYPLELWPTTQKGLLPTDAKSVETFEANYAKALDQPKWPGEASRFAAMKPLRDFVMAHYQAVHVAGNEIVFELKAGSPVKETH